MYLSNAEVEDFVVWTTQNYGLSVKFCHKATNNEGDSSTVGHVNSYRNLKHLTKSVVLCGWSLMTHASLIATYREGE